MRSYFENVIFSNEFDNESEKSILTITDDEEDTKYKDNMVLPILPIKNTVLFPSVVIPITVGREASIRLIKKVYKGNKIIGVVTQKNINLEELTIKDLYKIGTLSKILKFFILPDGNITIIIQGRKRFKVENLLTDKPYITAKARLISQASPPENRTSKALMESLKEAARKILKLKPNIPKEAHTAIDNIHNPIFITYFLSSNINIDTKDKQILLEIDDWEDRATKLLEHMYKEVQLLEIKNEIHNKTHSDIDQQQRDHFLKQQIKILQDELGIENNNQELDLLLKKERKKDYPQYAKEQFLKEVNKLKRINPSSSEYPVIFNYCEFLIELPWNKITKDDLNLHKAQKILDRDHYNLTKIKDRIIEYLAVLKLRNTLKGPILCLYGPPGVGKTSLGRSIANALGRKYVRISLGGMRDEAEIRGHRKTYVGAISGRILQSIKRVGYSNPVFILDEIEKIAVDFRNDASAALLEVLDPEQNNSFVDNYLEISYDLSKVLFIATANSLDTIHPALLDRMEVIEVNGYTQEEKTAIAKRYLIPKQRKKHGLTAKEITFNDKIIKKIIAEYTRESGVRDLERKIAAIIRNTAKLVVMKEPYQKKVNEIRTEKSLGKPIYDQEVYEASKYAGVAIGLAWTPVGGEILFIESSLNKGNGNLTLSGQLGKVMKESALTALSYLKTHANFFDIDHRIFQQYDLHIHVPAGAIPKDGPSAGTSILTSIVSAFTQRKIKPKLAMTGEITLRGKILPVGGIKEKLLAAKRSGIEEIIFCEKNKKDIHEIEKKYLEELSIQFVKTADELLKITLLKEKIKNPFIFNFEDKHKSEENKN